MPGELKYDPKQLHDAMALFKEKLTGKTRQVAKFAVESAMDFTPVDTGTNKRSITCDFSSNGSVVEHIGDMEIASDSTGIAQGESAGFRIYTQSGYGGCLEIGTSKMAPRPYIAPGFQSAVSDMARILEKSA